MKGRFLTGTALLALALLSWQATRITPVAAAPSFPPPQQSHRVPCPAGLTPNLLRLSWTIDSLGVIDRQQTGRRTIHRATTVSRLYGEICGLTLIRYDRPVTTSCPVPRTSIDVYHLVFARGTRKLLRVTEKANGCQFLSVDGRPDLGTAYLGQGLILPAGTPTAA